MAYEPYVAPTLEYGVAPSLDPYGATLAYEDGLAGPVVADKQAPIEQDADAATLAYPPSPACMERAAVAGAPSPLPAVERAVALHDAYAATLTYPPSPTCIGRAAMAGASSPAPAAERAAVLHDAYAATLAYDPSSSPAAPERARRAVVSSSLPAAARAASPAAVAAEAATQAYDPLSPAPAQRAVGSSPATTVPDAGPSVALDASPATTVKATTPRSGPSLSADARSGAAPREAAAPDPKVVPALVVAPRAPTRVRPRVRRRLRGKQPAAGAWAPERTAGGGVAARCAVPEDRRGPGSAGTATRSYDARWTAEQLRANAGDVGKTVEVRGDGWGSGRGMYMARVSEADDHTFTVIPIGSGHGREETHVLRAHCTVVATKRPRR